MPESMSKMRALKNGFVMGLMDIPTIVAVCNQQGLILDKMTRFQLISSLLNTIGPYFGYELIQHMMRKGVNNWGSEDFEVERILHHSKEKDGEYFLIQWKGWSSNFNSWEARENLSNCQELLEAYEKQSKQHTSLEKSEERTKNTKMSDSEARKAQMETLLEFLSERYYDNLLEELLAAALEIKKVQWLLRVRRTKMTFLSKFSKFTKAHKAHAMELSKTFSSWESRMNCDPNAAPIRIENNVDLEGLPPDFVYISKRFHEGAIAVDDVIRKGCRCKGDDCSSRQKSCCCATHGSAYTKLKRLRISEGQAIYECNRNCSCNENCQNRVVQLGRKVPLCLFRTANGRGWGVKAGCKIKRGTFVEEYVGEVITSEEAERRGQTYDMEGLTYLFDLDFHEKDCAFTIDAKTYGNISHFINHSCDPNLAVFNVWIDGHDERLPRIALFAIRDVSANEELTFDYKMDANNMTPTTPDVDSSPLNNNITFEEEAPANEKEDELKSSSLFPTLNDPQTTLTECSDLPMSDSGSPKSLVDQDPFDSKAANTEPLPVREFPVVPPQQGLRNVFAEAVPSPSVVPDHLDNVGFRSDTPSASSVSAPDFSFAGPTSEDQDWTSGRLLPPRRAKAKAIRKGKLMARSNHISQLPCLNPSVKLTACKNSMKKQQDRSEPWSEPSLKRMRIPCNCGAASCRKWLC